MAEQEQKSPDSAGGDADKHSRRPREILAVLIALLVGGLLAFGVYRLWRYETAHPSTENAYLNANYVWIVPQVTGQVVAIHVRENEYVKQGQPLFEIDPEPFRQRLRQAQAELVLVRHQLEADRAAVDLARAAVQEKEAALTIATQDRERIEPLVKRGLASEITGIQYENQEREAQAQLAEAKAQLAEQIANLGEPEAQQAHIDRSQAAVELARLQLDWTRVGAPADGYATRFELRVADVVGPGQQLFPFVESGEWWIEANFKETDVGRIRPGMPVAVTVDIYGDHVFRGVVESLSSASAASFSLLPPQNTTGNWVKVTQRIPIRIRMLDADPERPYRMGASCEVTVDTKAGVSEAQPGGGR